MINPDQSDPRRRYMMVYWAAGSGWPTRPMVYIGTRPGTAAPLPQRLPQPPGPRSGAEALVLYVRPSIRPSGMGRFRKACPTRAAGMALSTSPDLKTGDAAHGVSTPTNGTNRTTTTSWCSGGTVCSSRMHSQMTIENGQSENQVYLATSRDGIHWERTWDRGPSSRAGPRAASTAARWKSATCRPSRSARRC